MNKDKRWKLKNISFEGIGFEYLDKKVSPSPGRGILTVPKRLIGEKVRLIIIPNKEFIEKETTGDIKGGADYIKEFKKDYVNKIMVEDDGDDSIIN
jgi:hypothetical protein